MFSCPVTESSAISQARLQQIASQYNYTVVPASNKPDTIVKTEAGLINLLKQMNSGLNVPKTQSFGDTTNVDKTLIESLKKKLVGNNITPLNGKMNHSFAGDDGGGPTPGPVYKYSKSVYFDNTFPKPNVYVTINYNCDPSGNITGYEVVSGSWGIGLGTYSQINVVGTVQNGSLAFSVTGQLNTYINFTYSGSGLGSNGSGLSSGTTVNLTGWMQVVGSGIVTGGVVTEVIYRAPQQN